MLFCEHWGLNTHLKNDFNLNEMFVRSQLSVKTSVHRLKDGQNGTFLTAAASSTPSLCCSVWYTPVYHKTGFITVAYSIHRLLLAKHGQTNLLHLSPCVLSLL